MFGIFRFFLSLFTSFADKYGFQTAVLIGVITAVVLSFMGMIKLGKHFKTLYNNHLHHLQEGIKSVEKEVQCLSDKVDKKFEDTNTKISKLGEKVAFIEGKVSNLE